MSALTFLETPTGSFSDARSRLAGDRSQPVFPLPCLLVDLGVYHCHSSTITEDEPRGTPTITLDLAGFKSATDLIGGLIERMSPIKPRSVVIAFPGPVLGFRAEFTNSAWVVDCMEIFRRFGFENGILLNDQEAAACSVPDLGARDVVQLGSVDLQAGAGPEALISIRYGLGVGALRRFENRYVSQASEAGHIGISPVTPEDFAVLAAASAEIGRLNAEELVAHPGLGLIHRARSKVFDFADERWDAEAVATAALADASSEAAQSARFYARMVARYAGDVAIGLFATGGVTLSGSVLRRLASFMSEPEVRLAFENKAPISAMLERVPLRLALEDDLTVRGLAVLVQSPAHFAVSFDNRCWRQDIL